MRVYMLVINNFTHDARVYKEAKTLAAAGHEVTVVALWKTGLPEQEQQSGFKVKRLRLYTHRWRGRLVAPLVKYLEFALLVWRLAGRAPANVYHAHDAKTLPAAWLASRRAEAYLVYDAHELETGRNFGNSQLAGIYQHMWAWPEQVFIGRADAVLTVGNCIADELRELYGIKQPTVVMNCPEWQDVDSSSRLRNELGIPADQRIVLYVGRVAAGRGLELFLEAVQRLPGVVGVILGDGPLVPKFRENIRSGLWQRVYLPGKIPLAELANYIASADVGVALIEDTCRSYHFALPNKLFEYINAGIPVVGSDLPEIAPIIQDHQIGEVVNAEDLQSIVDGIQHLLNHPTYYQQAKANTQRIAKKFTWKKEGKKLLQLYHELENDKQRF
jgi:glycosyltransferase involved in cell wall biosynthesis